ncbi:MAG: hypothetical protein LBT05_05400 [Planctomycetaceae bacterium]|nr:hypothetical protein [Planctomycetaceae bacterium]
MQPKGQEVVLFFERLGRSSGSDLFQYVHLQFLLVGSDVVSTGWAEWSLQSGPVGGACRSRLDDQGMVVRSCV